MVATTRIYVVSPKAGGGKPRLVRAGHPSHALRHVADDSYTVTVASHDDLERLLPAGVAVERIAHEQQEIVG